MLNKWLALTAFCLCVGTGLAQNQFNAGLLGGAVASQVDGDNYGGFNKFGYHFGFAAGYSYRLCVD